MRRTAATLALVFAAAAVLLAAAGPAASAHKFHVSFAEADYDAAERSLQVSLRTFPDDLEGALSRRAGRRVLLDSKAEAERLTLEYLREVFVLKGADGGALALRWVGMESSVDTVWLYFEARAPAGLRGVRLSNRFMQDLYADQLNKTSVKAGGRTLSLIFRPGDGFKPLTRL